MESDSLELPGLMALLPSHSVPSTPERLFITGSNLTRSVPPSLPIFMHFLLNYNYIHFIIHILIHEYIYIGWNILLPWALRNAKERRVVRISDSGGGRGRERAISLRW
jgi:hypothetical protein